MYSTTFKELIMNNDPTVKMKATMNELFSEIDKLMKCVKVSYCKTLGQKTIIATAYIEHKLTGAKFVLSTGVANAYFEQLQDVPRGEQAAYKQAMETARSVLSNFVLFKQFTISELNTSTPVETNTTNLITN